MLYRLIAQSTPAWKSLSNKADSDNENFYKNYLFPVLGIIALLSFVGILLSSQVLNVQLALKTVIKQLFVYGGGFYLISHLVSEYLFPRFEMEKDRYLAERFVGYASSLLYVLVMVTAFFPDLFMLLVIFTFYIVWVGATHYLKIKEEQIVQFTVIAGMMIILTPALIDLIVGKLMPGMNK